MNYLVYHSPDSMGWTADEIEDFAIVTNKSTVDVIGDKIWLITGEGRPRKYSLVGWFIADSVGRSGDSAFGKRISGTQGTWFQPMPRFDGEEWFADFRRSQGNFAFGLQPINDQRFIRGLEAICATARPRPE